MFLKSFLLFFIQMQLVFTCDESESDITDTSFISEEYLNIFRTIPALFEYVMDVIEQKPEILEKDDVTVFTRDTESVSVTSGVGVAGDSMSEASLDSDEGYDEDLDIDFWDWYIGAIGSMRLSLTSTEVAEKVLEIERELEEYNAAKKTNV